MVIRNAAIAFLAKREHSFYELKQKLSRRFDSNTLILSVLQQLQGDNLQSDQRFTDVFIRHKMNAGKGPYVIRQQLVLKGVHTDLIEQGLHTLACNWYEQALLVYDKKYRGSSIIDYNDKAKRIRFLVSRGFSMDVVQQVID